MQSLMSMQLIGAKFISDNRVFMDRKFGAKILKMDEQMRTMFQGGKKQTKDFIHA